MKQLIFALAFSLALISCGHDEYLGTLAEVNETLEGTWLLTERGSSPGAGYFTEDVPDEPAQTISLSEGRKFRSNIDGLSKFKYYTLWEDTATSTTVMTLYEKNPRKKSAEESSASYAMSFSEGKLMLYFRWCIEGCHMGFKPLNRG